MALLTDLNRPWVKYVIGPDGSPLNFGDLPAQGTRLIRRKAVVVAAVRGGLFRSKRCAVEGFLACGALGNEQAASSRLTPRSRRAAVGRGSDTPSSSPCQCAPQRVPWRSNGKGPGS